MRESGSGSGQSDQYITRLTCVKEAIKRQLESHLVERPKTKVAIIAFETSVYVSQIHNHC